MLGHRMNNGSGGLRRFGSSAIMDDAKSEDSHSAIYAGGSIDGHSSSSTMISSMAIALEEQKQQLFGICEMVQTNCRNLLDQIGRIIIGIGQQNAKSPLHLLSEYEASI